MAQKRGPFKRKTHSKLFVGHLTLNGNRFYVGDEIVTHVDILGTVVSIAVKGDTTLFEIDDGTGIISCAQFRRRGKGHEQEDLGLNCNFSEKDVNDIPSEDRIKNILFQESSSSSGHRKDIEHLDQHLLSIIKSTKYQPHSIHLGDLINIRGRLNVFHSKIQVIVNHFRHIKNPNETAYRVFEIEAFNKVYRPALDNPRS